MEDSRWRPSYLNPNQDAILGQLKACGEHRLQEGWINILSETGYLEGNTHTQGAVKALLNHPPKTGTCISAPTSPVEAISQRSTGSASLKRGQENMGAWWKQGHREQVFSTYAATQHRNMCRSARDGQLRSAYGGGVAGRKESLGISRLCCHLEVENRLHEEVTGTGSEAVGLYLKLQAEIILVSSAFKWRKKN